MFDVDWLIGLNELIRLNGEKGHAETRGTRRELEFEACRVRGFFYSYGFFEHQARLPVGRVWMVAPCLGFLIIPGCKINTIVAAIRIRSR